MYNHQMERLKLLAKQICDALNFQFRNQVFAVDKEYLDKIPDMLGKSIILSVDTAAFLNKDDTEGLALFRCDVGNVLCTNFQIWDTATWTPQGDLLIFIPEAYRYDSLPPKTELFIWFVTAKQIEPIGDPGAVIIASDREECLALTVGTGLVSVTEPKKIGTALEGEHARVVFCHDSNY
jgi:hypothetical protein